MQISTRTYPTDGYPDTKRGRSVRRHHLKTHGDWTFPPEANYWDASELAGFTRVPTRTLSQIRTGPDQLVFTRRGYGFEYVPADIRAWLNRVRVLPTDGTAELVGVPYDVDLRRKLLTPEGAARFFRLPASTLGSWRTRGKGPVYYRITPRTVRYAPGDLEHWVDSGASSYQ